MLLSRSEQPVILADQPWEKGGSLRAVALLPDQEADALRLYYLVRPADVALENTLCLARSKDGRQWSKPDLGDGTNIVMRASGNTCQWGEFMPTTILRDERAQDPAQRWKMLYWDRPDPAMPAGICLAVSPDGIAWSDLHGRPFITGYNDAMAMIDTIPGIKSPAFGETSYLLYQQTWSYDPALPAERDNLKKMRRGISLWKPLDLRDGRWAGPIKILEPDEADGPDIQFYGLLPFKTAEGVYGGLLNCHHTADQTMDMQLVSGRIALLAVSRPDPHVAGVMEKP